MSKTRLATASAFRPAILAAALLLALAAAIALAATASAQTPDDGNADAGNGGTTTTSGDAADDEGDDPVPPPGGIDDNQPDCSGLALESLQNVYFARLPGSNRVDSDKRIARIPQVDRLTDAQLQCALLLQDRKHPNLRWHFQTRCPLNELHSMRFTGVTRTVDGVLFDQIERIEDYRCTSTWRPIMTDGSTPPAGLIPPAQPVSIITVRYRVLLWRQAVVPGVAPDHSATPPPRESSLAD